MKSNNLKPYTLILRDVERALPLKEILDTKNINVLIEPIYQIAPIKFKPINFIEYQALLITSVNTIKMLIKTTSKEEIKTIKTYCVGKVTEKYALEAGFNCIKTNAKSGETLVDEVIKIVKDNNKKNYRKENIELLCYNHYFLTVGDIFTGKQIQGIEDHKPVNQGSVEWELDDYQRQRLIELGLEEKEDDGLDIISRL